MAIYIDEGIELFNRVKRSKDFKMSESHFHDKHELYYLVKGNSRYFVGDEIFMVNEGDMIFVPKGFFHKTNVEKNKDAERIILVFDDSFAGDDFVQYINCLKERKHVRFPSHKRYMIEEILNKIEKECKYENPDYILLQKLYLKELLILISRHRLQGEKSSSGDGFVLIENIMKYISANVNSDLSLSYLSQKYSISPNHLSKQFKKISGISLSEYINLARISSAEKLLKKGRIPITELATRCGFNDSNYFAAVFKKYKGITPKKYAMRNSW